jgi:hypothetical protein
MADTKKADAAPRPLEAEQVVNQGGTDTGTHSSSHRGVDWPASYRVRRGSGERSSPQQEIEVRAYEIYLQRGCEDGHDIDDWLQAENELKRK